MASNLQELEKTFIDQNKDFIFYYRKEFTASNLSSRFDYVIITWNGDIVGVEFKSDKDSLSRLNNQVREMSRFCDYVIVAVDYRHREDVKRFYESGDFLRLS